MKKIESAAKKLKNINVKGVLKGLHNKATEEEVDELAKTRAEICATCPKKQKEPIPALRVKDKELPEISECCCGVCGCTLSYLVRQSEEGCKLNKW